MSTSKWDLFCFIIAQYSIEGDIEVCGVDLILVRCCGERSSKKCGVAVLIKNFAMCGVHVILCVVYGEVDEFCVFANLDPTKINQFYQSINQSINQSIFLFQSNKHIWMRKCYIII